MREVKSMVEDARMLGFNQGFACAVSSLIKGHGCCKAAEELFDMIGDLSQVDEYDIEVFRECGLLPNSIRQQEKPR